MTGANGFIGSNLLQKLSLNSKNIIGFVRNKPNSHIKGIQYIHTDLSKKKKIDINKKIDVIIHLASVTDIDKCQKNPQLCFETNVQGSINVLDLARRKDARIIFASTSHVYGKPLLLPISEKHILNPISIYAASKASAEHLFHASSKSYGIKTDILRIFSPYGPYSPRHQIIGHIISQIVKSNSIHIGNIETKRDFIYIDDVLRAIIKAKNTKTNKTLRIFNVGTGKSIKIKDIILKFEKILGKKFLIFSEFKRKNDIPELKSNISLIKKELNWKPQISIDQGLEKTYNWYKNNVF